MKHETPIVTPLALPTPEDTDRLVKAGFVAAFRAVFYLKQQAKKTPAVLQQTMVDIREAWEEASRPNV